MSNITTVFLDHRPQGFIGFESYFTYAKMMRMMPYHQDLYIDRIVPLPTMSLTSLALSMPRVLQTGQNAVIYTHAEPNNFVFPIDASKPKNDFDVKEAANLSYHLDLLERCVQNGQVLDGDMFVDPFVAQKYHGYVNPFHKSNFKDKSPDYLKIVKVFGEYLMDQFLAIRKLKLEHLAIRACRIGQNKDFMRFLGLLFGAKSVSAPILRTASILGRATGVKVMSDKERPQFNALMSKHERGIGDTHIYKYENWFKAYGISEPMFFTFRYVKTGKTSFNLTTVVASQNEAAYEFLWKTAGYDELMSKVIGANIFALHALQGPERLIFPGEKEYLQNMAFVKI